MRKVMLGLATASLALLLSWDGSTFSITDAQARIGRPLTPFSVAGVHRRVMRRNFGPGWRGVGWHRHWRAPLATAAVAGAAVYGARHYGGCSCATPYYGGDYGAPGYGGWGSGFGVRPGFGFGAPGFGWHRGWF